MSPTHRATLGLAGSLLAVFVVSPYAGAGGNPAEVGQWLPPQPWPVIAIHAAVLPTGKVLHYSYPGGGPGSLAVIWDPESGQFDPVPVDTDLFCSGQSFLPNGFVYLTGGNDYNCKKGPQGRQFTHIFNPFTRGWAQLELMVDGRWYPTNLTLGDGRVLILSGVNRLCELNPIMEIFTPGLGLEVVPEGEREVSLYPRLHLLSSGKIAHVGAENLTATFDLDAGLWEFVDFTNLGWRCEGTSVLLPGRTDQIMIIGGSCPLTSSCEIIDFSNPTPQWQWTASMNHARAHANAVILPDQTVMIVGGGQTELYGDPVKTPELFDPTTETWLELPPQVYGRMYHSTAVLLPDGRVLSAGQNYGYSAHFGEIYEPAYLFRGPRPEISAVPARIAYNRPFSLGTPQAGDIGSVALVAPATVTHSLNTSQRYVGLIFEAIGEGAIHVIGPPNGNHAPPGYYMLFILNSQGVPSASKFVQLGAWPLGDLDGDGTVGIIDLLLLLAGWGSCAGCSADLDADGAVGILDLLTLLANWR
ncbi:MAG: DUF1929 domain-containing protein [Planctomycetota bacterium]|nr:DUF1929 domain-containing protein [Planctomycetota bacterium]